MFFGECVFCNHDHNYDSDADEYGSYDETGDIDNPISFEVVEQENEPDFDQLYEEDDEQSEGSSSENVSDIDDEKGHLSSDDKDEFHLSSDESESEASIDEFIAKRRRVT